MLEVLLKEKSCSSYKKRLEIILESMEIGQTYPVSNKECYFKLGFTQQSKVYVSNANVKEKGEGYGCTIANDKFTIIPFGETSSLFYQIEGYVNATSFMYIYSNNKEDEKLLIEYEKDNAIDFNKYANKSNEILFQLVKK